MGLAPTPKKNHPLPLRPQKCNQLFVFPGPPCLWEYFPKIIFYLKSSHNHYSIIITNMLTVISKLIHSDIKIITVIKSHHRVFLQKSHWQLTIDNLTII